MVHGKNNGYGDGGVVYNSCFCLVDDNRGERESYMCFSVKYCVFVINKHSDFVSFLSKSFDFLTSLCSHLFCLQFIVEFSEMSVSFNCCLF